MKKAESVLKNDNWIGQRFLLMLFSYLFVFLFLFSTVCYGDSSQTNSRLKNILQTKEHGKNAVAKKNKTIEDKDKVKEPPKLGNFSLPSSQQPGSFIAFGENIFDKGTWQLNIGSDYLKGVRMHSADVIPNIIYSLSDTSSILLSIPYAPKYKDEASHSSGIEDMIAQFEYAFYVSSNSCFSDQATVVMNVSFPTGSTSKQPPTGFGASTCFLGGTFLRTYIDWLLFTSQGILATTSHHGTKFGNAFLYQFGIGKNICYISDQLIFDWVLELTGQCTGRNRINREVDQNSGGNVVLLTPSLWFSTKHVILQFGIGKPIVQRLLGVQRKNNYVLLGNFAWTF